MTSRSGIIAIVGPPNVGKSTLLNRIIKTKISIVSPKPQTTRHRIMGIHHEEEGCEMAFIDTPGIHVTRSPFHKSMVESSLATCGEVDIVLFMIEVGRSDISEISPILQKLGGKGKPSILVINKVDLEARENLLPVMDNFGKAYPFDEIVPISALKGDGLDILLSKLKSRLKPGPALFPAGMKTDQSEKFWVSEIIREKIYFQARNELPYSSAVTVENMENTSRNLLSIIARIHVETESQKKILIGHRGQMIQKIGRSARKELEKRFGVRVYLDLFVRVEKNWSKDARALRRLGY